MFALRNNIAVIGAALVVIMFSWLYGGMRGSVLVPVMPWILAFLLEAMLFFPQQRDGETTYQARERCWKAMKRDPLVWVSVVFMLLLMIPFINYGLCPGCDIAKIAEGLSPNPPASFLPYCVNRIHHLTVVMWFVPALTAMLAVKHSLTSDGKRAFVEMLAWNAAILSVLGFVQQIYDAKGPLWCTADAMGNGTYFFSTFGYPNAGGPFFVACFCLAVAVWRWREEDVRQEMREKKDAVQFSRYTIFWRKNYMVIPALLIFIGALNTLCRAAIMTGTAVAILLVAHAAVCMLARLKKAARVKAGAVFVLLVVAISFAVSVFAPEKIRKEVGTIDAISTLDRVTNRSENHAKTAIDIMWDHPLFGCGGWGYAHLWPEKVYGDGKGKDKKGKRPRWFSPGSANVHNDYLQFLAEHGMVGFGILVVIVAMLVMPAGKVWKRLLKSARFEKDKAKRPPRPIAVFALPAGAFAVLSAEVVILIHAFGDCPLRSPAVLSLFFTSLAAIGGFLPKLEEDNDNHK